ncbi:sensor domain-containing diguanylate cyclase [Marinobacter zhanjiangensis]|uniref:GGDEF domain-containing protein n=1 Tax=Marinobacter zhanjiangensis TaxID=578215 RepID=A0ABQ3AUF0_9GAMM|nr:sensor domain-containing diguanylate cyclase [Marinobacter zhanjiangensis]GGY67540.1 hypothetical protein GCM10007071_13170 [Marinobacter zhanjiangensis]
MKLARFVQTEMMQLLEDLQETGPECRGEDSRALKEHSHSMEHLVSAPLRDIDRKTPLDLVLELATELHDAISKTVTTGQSQRREFHLCLPSYFDCQFVPVFNGQNEIEAVVKTSRDISERRQTDYQAWRSVNFDPLTGLPNRLLFIDRLERVLLEAQREGSSFALLFIGLDGFKQTNDQLGHKAADRLLAQVAERISTRVRTMDTLARLGGDEFTLILQETNRNGAKEAARKVLTSLKQGFEVDSQRIHISGSIGLALFPNDGQDVDTLMDDADQAMYAAKAHGGQRVQVYESSMAPRESEQTWLSKDLHDALRENQLRAC